MGLSFGSLELARCPQLVAFVAPQRVEVAKDIAPLEMQRDHASIVRTRFSAEERNGGAPGFYAVQAKATMPAVPRARPIVTSSASAAKRILKRPAVKNAPLAVRSRDCRVETRQELAIAGDGVEEHWVVLTRWEQVQTTNPGDRSRRIMTLARQTAQSGRRRTERRQRKRIHPEGTGRRSGDDYATDIESRACEFHFHSAGDGFARRLVRVSTVSSTSKNQARG